MPPMFNMPPGMGMPSGPPPHGCPPPFGFPHQYENGPFPGHGFPPPPFPSARNDANGTNPDEVEVGAECDRRMQHRAWRRFCRQHFGEDFKKKCHKGEKRCKKQEKKEKKEKKRKEDKAKEGAAPEGGAAAEADKKEKDSSSSDSSSSDEADKSPTEDYLKNVGKSVAAMLDPLGECLFK